MKIVVLTGSPHHPGTSEQLADAFVKGASAAGNEVYRFDAGRRVNEFSMIKLADNHIITKEVMPKLLDADMVVLVSSLYYYGINAALKAVIDRFYNYNHKLHGNKKAVTLVSGYGQEDAFASLNLYFDQLLNYMRWDKVGSVLAADSWNEQKLAKHVEEAYDLGKSIR